MRILLVSLLALNFASANKAVSYLMIQSLYNDKEIKFNQESFNCLAPFLTKNLNDTKKLLDLLIRYGIEKGFNYNTSLGRFKLKNLNQKEVPSVEKVSSPIADENYRLEIKFDAEKFGRVKGDKLAIIIGGFDEKDKFNILVTPPMKALIKELEEKYTIQ